MLSIINGRHRTKSRTAKDFSYFNSVRRYDRETSMKPQFGVCKNKVGCSFAYTGEKIPVPADSKCPECGQPLVVETSKKGGAKVLVVLGLLLLVILIGAGAALFAFKDQIFHLAFNKPETIQKGSDSQGEDVSAGASASPAENQDTATTPAASPNGVSTADSSSSNQEKKDVVAPNETPAPLPPPTVEQGKQKSLVPPNPSPGIQTENSTPSEGSTRTDADKPPAVGGEIQPPATLTKSEVDATREDVLKRINAMPRFTTEEKKRLSEKMETARSMDRLMVIRFDTGQTALSRAATDDLMKRIKSKDVEDKLSDPTIVFVVAGYADAAGDPKSNLQISQQRADNVTKVLKDKTNLLNVIHSVGMGSTALLDGKRLDQNRAVEIWAVAP
jgi:outer membrane protein OmpA-like peptidoglycan-associated protein